MEQPYRESGETTPQRATELYVTPIEKQEPILTKIYFANIDWDWLRSLAIEIHEKEDID